MSDTKTTAVDPETEEAREAASAEWEETDRKIQAADELGEEENNNENDQ